MCCSDKLDDDEEFEVIGDVSQAQQTDDNSLTTAAANGNNLRTNDGTSLLSTLKPHSWTALKLGLYL